MLWSCFLPAALARGKPEGQPHRRPWPFDRGASAARARRSVGRPDWHWPPRSPVAGLGSCGARAEVRRPRGRWRDGSAEGRHRRGRRHEFDLTSKARQAYAETRSLRVRPPRRPRQPPGRVSALRASRWPRCGAGACLAASRRGTSPAGLARPGLASTAPTPQRPRLLGGTNDRPRERHSQASDRGTGALSSSLPGANQQAFRQLCTHPP